MRQQSTRQQMGFSYFVKPFIKLLYYRCWRLGTVADQATTKNVSHFGDIMSFVFGLGDSTLAHKRVAYSPVLRSYQLSLK